MNEEEQSFSDLSLSAKVRKTISECLYRDADLMLDCNGDPAELPADTVLAEGVIRRYGFDPKRVAAQKENIRAMLNELAYAFHIDQGGGSSFLNACMDKHGNHWAEHPTIDDLICLGLATGFVTFPMPRKVWSLLPGGVPYFTVDTRQAKD